MQRQLRDYDSMLQDSYSENAKKEIFRRRMVLKEALESTNMQNEEFFKQVKLNQHQTYINFPEKIVVYNKLLMSKTLL